MGRTKTTTKSRFVDALHRRFHLGRITKDTVCSIESIPQTIEKCPVNDRWIRDMLQVIEDAAVKAASVDGYEEDGKKQGFFHFDIQDNILNENITCGVFQTSPMTRGPWVQYVRWLKTKYGSSVKWSQFKNDPAGQHAMETLETLANAFAKRHPEWDVFADDFPSGIQYNPKPGRPYVYICDNGTSWSLWFPIDK